MGLGECELILYVDNTTGQIVVVGEAFVWKDTTQISEFTNIGAEIVEVWRCPPELRAMGRADAMEAALADVRAHTASWSWATAVRAFILSGEVKVATAGDGDFSAVHAVDGPKVLEEIQQCWLAEPICTSIVIAFWQRYLCKLAAEISIDSHTHCRSALDMILLWMPLKADRVLPGQLLSAMRSHGWSNVTSVPIVATRETIAEVGSRLIRCNSL